MLQFKRGTITGTGAAINVTLGFLADSVKVFNPINGMSLSWNRSMGTTFAGFKSGTKYNLTGILTANRAAIGSTKSQVANTAFTYELAGVKYAKTATAAGTALTATTCAHSDAHAHFACFGFEIGTDGTIANLDAPANNTGYDTEAAAIAAIPAATASHVLFSYITVEIAAAGADFVGATTLLDATGYITRYYNVPSWHTIVANGISDYGTTGFTLGTDSDINVSGETLYYEAIGVH